MLGRKREEWLDCSQEGRLRLLRRRWWFRLLNVLSLGARESRVRLAIEYTFIASLIEIYHPFDQEKLKIYAARKIAFVQRMLKRVPEINGRRWEQEGINHHIEIFRRASILQGRIIDQIERAAGRQEEPPIVAEVKEGMRRGITPRLVIRGSSGAYWMRGPSREILGIFKPFDEEAFTPNNPVGPRIQGALGQRRMRSGIRQGEMAHREVAAFVIDEFFEFGIVPRTYYATFRHGVFFHNDEDPYATPRRVKTKIGSFQEFIAGFDSMDKLSKKEWAQVPLDEFQLLVLLDVILGNSDRHMGNILISEGKLAAIDHGLTLPDRQERMLTWYWQAFPQGKEPFLPAIIELLAQFPFEALGHRLHSQCLIDLRCLLRMRERVALLCAAAQMGKTPAELDGLFTLEHLAPLKDLDATLPEKAKEVVIAFIDKGI